MEAEIKVSVLQRRCQLAVKGIQDRRLELLKEDYKKKQEAGLFFGLIKYTGSFDAYLENDDRTPFGIGGYYWQDMGTILNAGLFCTALLGSDIVTIDSDTLVTITNWTPTGTK